jgi:2-keto-3-deoxy-L-rhamnonate aldolase RhmA
MPPRGERRPGGHGNWWVSDFNYASWKEQVEERFITLMQIESPRGVENAAAIAAQEATTALAVGPYDLSARLGVCWQPDHPQLQAALATIRSAAAGAGKPMWMIGDGVALAQQGYNFLCVAEPSNLLKAALLQMNNQIREGTKPHDGANLKAFVP